MKYFYLLLFLFVGWAGVAQPTGPAPSCTFATIVTMNAFAPSLTDDQCTKVFVSSTNEYYNWDGSVWVYDAVGRVGANQVAWSGDGKNIKGESSLTFDGNTFEVSNPVTPKIRLRENATDYTSLEDIGTYLRIRKYSVGGGGIDIDPFATNGTGLAQVRLLRNTNSTGATGLYIFPGNATSLPQHVFSGNGDSYINSIGGNLGIGTNLPEYKLDFKTTEPKNIRLSPTTFLGTTFQDNATVLGNNVKADIGLVSGQALQTMTGTGLDAPSMIKMGSGNIDFHTLLSGLGNAVMDNRRFSVQANGDIIIDNLVDAPFLKTNTAGTIQKGDLKELKNQLNIVEGLINYSRAIAGVEENIINIILDGDSKTNNRDYSSRALREYLISKYGSAGPGYYSFGAQPPFGLWFSQPAGHSNVVLDNTGDALYSYNGMAVQITQAGDYYQVQSDVQNFGDHANFTDFDIWILREPGAGSLDVVVDGVVKLAFGSLNAGSVFSQKWTVSGLADAPHNVQFLVNNPSTSGTTLLDANWRRETGKGVRFHKVGNSGFQANQRLALLDGEGQSIIADISPDLVLLRYGANDFSVAVDPAVYKQNLKDIATIYQSNGPASGQSILIVAPEDNNLPANTYTVAQYNTAAIEAANEEGYEYIDLLKHVPDWTTFTTQGYTLDNVHENKEGGDFVGGVIFNKIDFAYDKHLKIFRQSGTNTFLSDGSFSLSEYGVSSTHTGTPVSFSAWDNTGQFIQRTAVELKADLGVSSNWEIDVDGKNRSLIDNNVVAKPGFGFDAKDNLGNTKINLDGQTGIIKLKDFTATNGGEIDIFAGTARDLNINMLGLTSTIHFQNNGVNILDVGLKETHYNYEAGENTTGLATGNLVIDDAGNKIRKDYSVRTITASGTSLLLRDDKTVIADASANSLTINIDPGTMETGQLYMIKTFGNTTNTVSIQSTVGAIFLTELAATQPIIFGNGTDNGKGISFFSNGINLYVIQ